MAFARFKRSGTMNPEISEREKSHSSFAELAAEECIVLLKNENILPLPLFAPIALLGSGADKTVKGGIGSGDVNNRQNITIYEGMMRMPPIRLLCRRGVLYPKKILRGQVPLFM